MKIEETDHGTLEHWSPDEVQTALDEGEIVLIDVRSPQEYGTEHIEGALLMPMAFFRADRLPTQDGKRVVFHCAGGLRSQRMAKIALESGLAPIAHMAGGFGEWKAQKKPYIGTDFMTGAPKRMP
ncbi:rhodanese-related sulfurtransferase [Palleronia aestuarii]|uniref:Rhodanese-related sulfurtransferase n=1 Tax=Palleronia aestuarii TaxID=568105 RepID=A0A2W7P650_9RHOB|nr:rhodanese-like domain-containing protein [Palleronia aestuarii]PZX18882.1 rhodanese-related sulfurtransferase [Palleronia aestuarii]